MTATRETVTQLQNLYQYLKTEDPAQSEKVLDVINKLMHEKVMVGFGGHFSAGKSTLINHLLDKQMLPSSPIPTSANIVEIKAGEPYTMTYFHHDLPEKYEGETDFETIQALCKNGSDISRVVISRPDCNLPEHVTVLDTPGVDSTNDADRLITESSLHLMDVLYYVMDYNHVQSEVNVKFLMEMQERGTPFSVVINQIDKHNEAELSFEDFKQSVEHSFSSRGIKPEAIYYISLKDFSYDKNEYESLKEAFTQLYSSSYVRVQEQALKAAETIIEESVHNQSNEFFQRKQDLKARKEYLDESMSESYLTQEDRKDTEQVISEAADFFKRRVSSFIPNAYLMPSSLRDEAEKFLESRQRGFKVGVLFAKKKTEEVKEERESAFYAEVLESIEKNLKWPLKERLLEVTEELSITDEELQNDIQRFNFIYEKAKLQDMIEPGASVTGPYILRYTDQLSNDIKKEMRQYVNQWWEQVERHIRNEKKREYEKNKTVFQAMEEKEHIVKELEQMEKNLTSYRKNLYKSLENETLSSMVKDSVKNDLEERAKRVQHKQITNESLTKSVEGNFDENPAPESSLTEGPASIDSTMERVTEALSIVEDVEGMDEFIQQLRDKQDRLRNRHYTVALFGAFSAGKSSFANALLGDTLLPASPNPTTATINKISPSSDDHPHGSIQAVVKKEKELLDDLEPIFTKLELRSETLYGYVKQLETVQSWSRLEHKSASFLEAFLNGYNSMKDDLGQSISIPWDEFSMYVAEESKSCFIESVEIFYDCSFTEAGITLVDTPGADSVNARHTDVSFEYIKDADAVLFVTYYNHPFSKADQSFLTQLGRVKDSFAMDKMFFIINAVDLASSEEEVKYVENYVADQLGGFDIRNPRLFSLSSLKGLREKKGEPGQSSGINKFEAQFNQFLHGELAEVLTQSMERNLSELKDTLATFIDNNQLNEEERKQFLKKARAQREEALDVIKDFDRMKEKESLKNKIDKQLYYVHHRMMLNFTDYFKHHFNPATINGKDQPIPDQLREARDNLIQEIEFEMNQEFKAVGVRIERLLDGLIDQIQQESEAELKKVRNHLRLERREWTSIPLPSFYGELVIDERQTSSILKKFKSARAFFELNEKEEMKDELADLISPILKNQLDKANNIMKDYYEQQWLYLLDEHVHEWRHQIDASFNSLLYSVEHPADIAPLERKFEQIKKLV
ncbi:dynamin family protein [Halobacillus halophilus]|uniref:dynamin family protein n=1 Tax=Halobacillus halophilus TaxID=1570 RepID=UPI001CD2A055|nr:dynamin family protein [Halobacillus halophilus]MCA1009383.1 dynamin family protein [Halobacillus halophilus]